MTDEVPVTQADRDAAADIESFACGPKEEVKAIREGRRDRDYLVQAFARHRLNNRTAQADVVEAIISWLRVDDGKGCDDWCDAADAFADYIEERIIPRFASPTKAGGDSDGLALIEAVFKAGHSDGWRGNQLRRKVQHDDAQDGWDALVRNNARVVRELIAALSTPSDNALREALEGEEQQGFTYYECRECGFNSVLKGDPCRDPCPMCAEDNGRDIIMSTRVARSTDKPEGADARQALRGAS